MRAPFPANSLHKSILLRRGGAGGCCESKDKGDSDPANIVSGNRVLLANCVSDLLPTAAVSGLLL